MKYLYYPGCSLKGMGKAYEKSLLAVFKALGAELNELDDWNCCGATAYISVDEMSAVALATRNLALAEKQGLDMIAPCSSCYLVLNKAQHYMGDYPEVNRRVSQGLKAIGLSYDGGVKVRHPLDVLVNDIGLDAIKAKVTQPLKDLKVAPYYGCQTVRPYATFDDQHNPTTMDKVLEAIGAEVVDYEYKTKCCGASLTGNLPEVGVPLAYILLKEAQRQGADVVATVCPLCQFNLDGFQDRIERKFEKIDMPVVFLTQLIGLALGLPASDLDLSAGIVPAQPILAKRGVAHV